MNQKVAVVFLVSGIVIKNAIQGITIPIIAQYYESLNFILLSSSLQFLIIFGVLYLILSKGKPKLPQYKTTILFCGIFNALMAMFLMYSANPMRTPIIMQTILAGIPVIPGFILRKFLVDRIVIYDKKYILGSLSLITISLGLSTIPLTSNWNYHSIIWIIVFTFGIIFQSTYNVLQERYMKKVDDDSFLNKVTLIFYTRVIEFIILLSFSWIEIYVGYQSNPIMAFFESFNRFLTDFVSMALLEGFVLAYLCSYLMSVYLNSISVNYNMLTPIISNPIVAMFYTIFKEYNNGIQYPIWLVLIILASSVAGLIVWIKGERNTNYLPIRNKGINDDEELE